jgi:hypothetical protein
MPAAAFESADTQLTLWTGEPSAQHWHIRESRRARRLSVRISNTGRVEVIAPPRTSARIIDSFLTRHRDWIERQRERAARLALPAQPFPPRRIELTACRQTLRVHLAGGADRVRVTTPAPDLLSIAGDIGRAPAVRAALQVWLMNRARTLLAPMLAELARELGFQYRRLAIRRQRTRWGSCSSRGTISLNVCLLFQRPEVVRYLLIHELVHTRHMNHSIRFWQAVAARCPDYRRLDRELLEGWRRVPGWVMEG